MLGSDEMRAWYGPGHVQLAADRDAIGTLLISDELFRSVEFLAEIRSHFSDARAQGERPPREEEIRSPR